MYGMSTVLSWEAGNGQIASLGAAAARSMIHCQCCSYIEVLSAVDEQCSYAVMLLAEVSLVPTDSEGLTSR